MIIQLDENEKQLVSSPPPSYTPIGSEHGLPTYPPSGLSPMPTGMPSPNGQTSQVMGPPVTSPPSTSTSPQMPAVSPQPTGLQVPSPYALSPGGAEAALGQQYQQQLFARCARGEHDVENSYGPCGIISAVLLFPIGLIFLFMDVKKKCSRCGVVLA